MPPARLLVAKVTDIEKRRSPSKHYVYVIEVEWSDGSEHRIGRRFSAFFDMHMALLERFPKEGGQKDPTKRILPFLPGKVLFQRSHTKEVTLKRLQSITTYCQELNKLPESISQCDIIKNFFQPNSEDQSHFIKESSSAGAPASEARSITAPIETEEYVAVADFRAEDNTQVSLNAGEAVDVVEKNENGWWLVCNTYGSNGWVPGTFLEKPDGKKENLVTEKADPGKGTWYRATSGHQATSEDEVSFPLGALLEVLQKNLEGWWLARYKGAEGWVPGSYLQKRQTEAGSENSDVAEQGAAAKPTRKLVPRRSTVKRQLPTRDEQPTERRHVTLYKFESKADGGISFDCGEIVQVLEQSDNGWWFVTLNGRKGWVPASYLTAYTPKAQKSVSPRRPLTPTPNLSPTFPLPSPASRNEKPPVEHTKMKTGPHLPPRPPTHSKDLPQKHKPGTKPTSAQPSGRKLDFGAKFGQKKTDDVRLTSLPAWQRTSGALADASRANDSSVGRQRESKAVEEERWFRSIGRTEAEKLLSSVAKEGCFIVRPSSKGGPSNPYALTLSHRGSIFNFHIRRREDGRYATGAPSEGEKSFGSVREIIDFYRENTLVVGDLSNLVKLTGSP